MTIHQFLRNKGISKISLLAIFLAAFCLATGVWPAADQHSHIQSPKSKQLPIPAHIYVIWQPIAGRGFSKATNGKPVGGNIILRVVISPVDGKPSRVSVSDTTIRELKNKVHPTHTVQLQTKFSTAIPNPIWGDPTDSIVLQSTPIETATFHNMPHTIGSEVNYTSISGGHRINIAGRITFENLILKDLTKPRYIVNLDEKTVFTCQLKHAQAGTCKLKYEIFRSEDNTEPVIVKIFNNLQYPGEHSWIFDDKHFEAKPDDSGLLTYRITAESTSNPKDMDCNRSSYLQVVRTLNPDGTPDMTIEHIGDGVNNIYSLSAGDINKFVLKDSLGKNAKSGEQWFYNYCELLETWNMSKLKCRKNRNPCAASKAGIKHSIEIWVNDKPLDEGIDSYITHVVDDHADMYKDHKLKPALELN